NPGNASGFVYGGPGTYVYGSVSVGFTNVNGLVYFVGDDGIHGRELWQSDGSNAGTVMVQDIYPGGDFNGNPNSSDPSSPVAFNNNLYSAAEAGIQGGELGDPPAVVTGQTEDAANGYENINFPPSAPPGASLANVLVNNPAEDTLPMQ